MKLKLILSAALMAGVISASAATAPAPASTNATPEDTMKALFGDPVIVQGDGFQIKRSELDQVVSSAKSSAASAGQQLPPDFDVGVLNQLITIQLLTKQATAADRAAGKVDADLQYTNLLKRFGSEEAFQRQLQVVGMTADELRAKALQEAVAKAVLKRVLNVTVTDADAKAYYTNHPADFEEPEKVHVRHILLATVDLNTRPPTPLSTNAVAAKRKQADDLLKQIRGGADFAKLANDFSDDKNSAVNGGDLGEFPRGQMLPEFETAAFALNKDQVSDVVTSQYGFHIIKLIDKTAAKKVDYATVADDLKEGLTRQKMSKLTPDYVRKMRAGAKLEILDPELKAASERVEAASKEEAAAPSADATSK